MAYKYHFIGSYDDACSGCHFRWRLFGSDTILNGLQEPAQILTHAGASPSASGSTRVHHGYSVSSRTRWACA